MVRSKSRLKKKIAKSGDRITKVTSSGRKSKNEIQNKDEGTINASFDLEHFAGAEGYHEGIEGSMHRNVLFRPDRYKYVRKVDRPAGCVFCVSARVDASFSSLCVFKSQHCMILLNKFPYNSGHLLVLPQLHSGDLLTLSDEIYMDLQWTIRLAFGALQNIYQPQGVNLGMNHGAVAGAGIPEHLHYHLIPRWAGDLNFFPLIAQTKVVVETLEETYTKVSSYLSNKLEK